MSLQLPQVPFQWASWTEDRRVSHGPTMSQAIYDVGSQSFDPMWEEAYADPWRSDTYVEKIATPMCFWTVRLLDIFGKTCTVSVMVFACDCDCVVSSLVALTTSYIPTYIHTYLHTYIHTRSFTTSFVFPSFPVPAETIEAHFRKKLTCGVIRSFNWCFCHMENYIDLTALFSQVRHG